MREHVFISYATEDQMVASDVVAALEARGVPCWICSRDLRRHGGGAWPTLLMDAVGASRAMVVILSENANRSPHVVREIGHAVDASVEIVPYRIENVPPSKEISYFIKRHQWIDALTRPLDLPILIDSVQSLLAAPGTSTPLAAPVAPVVPPPPARRRERWIAAVLVALGALALLMARPWKDAASPRPPAAAAARDGALKSPPDTALVLAPTLILEWDTLARDTTDLSWQVNYAVEGAAETQHSLTGNSFAVPPESEGRIVWKVRAVRRGADGTPKTGSWTEPRSVTYFANALRRVLATHTLKVGIAEADEIFVKDDNNAVRGIEIEYLQLLGELLLRQNHVAGPLRLDHDYKPWGDDFFHLLETDPSLDLIASGISINPAREKKYGFVFTRPTFQYPQTILTRKGQLVLQGGRLTVRRLAYIANTTAKDLVERFAGLHFDVEGLPQPSGKTAYVKMLGELSAGGVDGVIMDKPYAYLHATRFKQDRGVDFDKFDVTAELVPGLEPEHVGMALRGSDSALREALNALIEATAAERRKLAEKYLPGSGL